MKLEKTERSTYKVNWKQGGLEVNLIPANSLLPTSGYCHSAFGGKLISTHDNVGITSLKLNDCPPVPRICWDNREHHFWDNFNGGFLPRNTIVNDIRVNQSKDDSLVNISFFYIVNFVKITESWFFQETEYDNFAMWDTIFTFENLNSFTLKNYMSFFACYHQSGKNYYWDKQDKISECADSFRAFSNEEKEQRNQEITAEYREQVKGWGIKNPTRASVLYGKPVLMSGRKEWFRNGQHVIFVETDKCLSIVSAMNQARDYMLAPRQKDLRPRELFSARVRHIIANIENMEDLKRRWEIFMEDVVANQPRI